MEISINDLKNTLRIEQDDDSLDQLLTMYLLSAKDYVVNAVGCEPENDELFKMAVISMAVFFYQNPDLSKQTAASKYSYQFVSMNALINQLRGKYYHDESE